VPVPKRLRALSARGKPVTIQEFVVRLQSCMEWEFSSEYFRFEGLLYKRRTYDGVPRAQWYRVDGPNVETLINPEALERQYQRSFYDRMGRV
jgi:hypothetical protein